MIAFTPENALDIKQRYYGNPALFLEQILGMKLDSWQKELCNNFHQQDRFAVSSGHSSGKALSASTVIPTPDGDKQMSSLAVGDTVWGADGHPTVISGVYPQGVRDIYKVVLSDHTIVYADKEHLWQVSSRNERRRQRADVVVTTGDMMEKGCWRKNGKHLARVFRLPRHEAVDGQGESIWAYALGVWLGDGHSGCASYHKPYNEVRDHLRDIGVDVIARKDGSTNTIKGLCKVLDEYGIKKLRSYERFVPGDFFALGKESRGELLRGLLDTDGECDKYGHVVFGSTSLQLAKDVQRLVRSLGGKSSLNPTIKHPSYSSPSGEKVCCRDFYRVSLTMPGGFGCFYIKHKAEREKPPGRESLFRYIDSIQYSHREDAICIAVEAPDKLFLANDYVVTHNTALTAGLIIYFLAVHTDPQVIVTANTELQLRQKTWRELAKWHNSSLIKDWFTWTATTYSLKGAEETWFAAAVPNTPHSAESFAGAHEKYMLLIFDEASAIDRAIWETAEGATATEGGYRKWIAFGNPTRTDGAFHECFHRKKHRWAIRHLDTRQCKYADQEQIKQWAEDYGEESDFFRIRVRGLFPAQSVVQLIGMGVANEAAGRTIDGQVYGYAPKVIGVDVARFGDDSTVITRRQGLKVWPQIVMRGLNTMAVATRVAYEMQDWHPQSVFIDETGLGAGVVDRLIQLGFSVMGVNSAAKPDEGKFLNKRAEMWSIMADWLKQADIPDDSGLIEEMTSPEYFYTPAGKLQLESKDSLKKRGLSSPDKADSLALTFAYPVTAHLEDRFIPQSEKDWRELTGYDTENAVCLNLED